MEVLRGFAKGLVCVPPLPTNVDELKAQMTEAVATIYNAMLERVWKELDYRLVMCSVIHGAYIEHSIKNLKIASFQNISDALLYS